MIIKIMSLFQLDSLNEPLLKFNKNKDKCINYSINSNYKDNSSKIKLNLLKKYNDSRFSIINKNYHKLTPSILNYYHSLDKKTTISEIGIHKINSSSKNYHFKISNFKILSNKCNTIIIDSLIIKKISINLIEAKEILSLLVKLN